MTLLLLAKYHLIIFNGRTDHSKNQIFIDRRNLFLNRFAQQFMPTPKPIVDIRYFESSVPNEDGHEPGEVGKILKLPKSVHFAGARIARKLGELGFSAGTVDHLYVNFTTASKSNQIAYAQKNPDTEHPWYRYVDVGVDAAKINRLSSRKLQQWLNTTTLDVTDFVSKTKKQKSIVAEVRRRVEEEGENLEIVHKTKETKTYSVEVSYRIGSKNGSSSAWVTYRDRQRNETRKGRLTTLNFYEDIFFLVASASISNGTIRFKPRPSFKAKIYNKKYKVPLSLQIADLPLVSD